MAELTRSTVASFVQESTEGTYTPETAASFVPVREGFAFNPVLNTVETDEFVGGDIGQSKTFATFEDPTISFPIYWRHSGTEATAPEWGILMESCLGASSGPDAEITLAGGSTTTVLKVADTSTFEVGQGLLIKDATNGYSARSVKSVPNGTDLELNFALANAPASGVALGRTILYKPGISHPTYTSHHFQATTSSAFRQAFTGCRTTNLTMDFNANDLAQGTVDAGGIKSFFNPVTIDSSNEYVDFTDDGGTTSFTLENKTYQTPIELAAEIQTKGQAAATASGGDDFLCSYSNSTGKFTISTTTGTLLSLLWNSGTNTANGAHTVLGYSSAADDTGSLTYESDDSQDYNPGSNGADTSGAITPSYDGEDQIVIKNGELLIGTQSESTCRKASSISFTVATPKENVPSICATSGISESITNDRTATLTAQVLIEEHEVTYFNALINNSDVAVQLNVGPKDSSGNWQAGKTFSVYLGNATISQANPIDLNGYYVFDLAINGFVTNTLSDVYVNVM